MSEAKWIYGTPFEKPCQCDIDLALYLRSCHRQNVFHFGTGLHHTVGINAHNLNQGLIVHGVTTCAAEVNRYMELTGENPDLMKTYKVSYCDIYSIHPSELPKYDIVSLFHVGEYSLSVDDDCRLIDMMIEALKPGGLMMFFKDSTGYGKASVSYAATKRLKFVRNENSLILFRRV